MSEEAGVYLVHATITLSPLNLLLVQELVRRLPDADPEDAKGIRASLRSLGFRIENFKSGGPRFNLTDLQAAYDSGAIKVGFE